MGSKTSLVLVLLLAAVLLLSAEVAPKNVDGKFDENDGKFDTNEVDDMKYGGWGRGGYGGGWGGGGGFGGGGWGGRGGFGGGGWGGRYCRYGCCGWSYYGNFCRRCCYFPGQHVDSDTDAAQPRT